MLPTPASRHIPRAAQSPEALTHHVPSLPPPAGPAQFAPRSRLRNFVFFFLPSCPSHPHFCRSVALCCCCCCCSAGTAPQRLHRLPSAFFSPPSSSSTSTTINTTTHFLPPSHYPSVSPLACFISLPAFILPISSNRSIFPLPILPILLFSFRLSPAGFWLHFALLDFFCAS